jgi:hypothetical protein
MQLKLPGKYLAIREVGSFNKKTKGHVFSGHCAQECTIWPDGGREPKSNPRFNKE